METLNTFSYYKIHMNIGEFEHNAGLNRKANMKFNTLSNLTWVKFNRLLNSIQCDKFNTMCDLQNEKIQHNKLKNLQYQNTMLNSTQFHP